MSFTDDVLPGFDAPAPTVRRERSKKDDADAAGIRWTRYKGASVGCTVCVGEHAAKTRPGISPAAYIRTHGDQTLYMCHQHSVAQRDREALGRG